MSSSQRDTTRSVVLKPEERLKRLEENANDFQLDHGQPIRRYYLTGCQMIRMADTYFDENSLEKAYVMYHKYLTLFIEKIPHHPEFKAYSNIQKANVMKCIKSKIMPKCEELKSTLRYQFQTEYEVWRDQILKQEKLEAHHRAEVERQENEQRLREEFEKYHLKKEQSLAVARDHEVALWQQAVINKEEELFHPKQSENPLIPDRSTKPTFSLYDNNSTSRLRPIKIPQVLMAKFLSLVDSNTRKNLETCGILAGKLSRNQFFITHLIIPKQSATSDSCVTKDEEELFEVQEACDLITLGWIHTHPSQTAFLSSVDLHTQLSYQLMLPEAIAIVCAPKHNEIGYFVLTPNYGLDFISNCPESGFHPHPKEPPLFEEGTHIELDDDCDVTVIDLR